MSNLSGAFYRELDVITSFPDLKRSQYSMVQSWMRHEFPQQVYKCVENGKRQGFSG